MQAGRTTRQRGATWREAHSAVIAGKGPETEEVRAYLLGGSGKDGLPV